MREYEVKVSVEDLDKVELSLKKLDALFIGYREEHDYYIDTSPCVDLASADSALRLRVSKDIVKHSVSCELTFKGPREKHEYAKIRKEITVIIDDAEKMLDVLKALGFKVLAVVSKKRKVYRYGNCYIYLDEVEGLGKFVEIEYIVGSDKDSKEMPEGYIMKVVEILGIPKNFILKSYLELILSKINTTKLSRS